MPPVAKRTFRLKSGLIGAGRHRIGSARLPAPRDCIRVAGYHAIQKIHPMKTFMSITEIAAPVETVWAVLSNVDRWPDWLPTVAEVEAGACGTVCAGQVLRIRHGGLGTLDWTVADVRQPRGFTRVATLPGVTLEADHTLDPLPRNETVLRLRLRIDGAGGRLLARFRASFLQAWLIREAEALRLRAEPTRWLW
jgi:hypothetical protein